MCYAVEGQGSKSFDMDSVFNTEAAHVLLQKITDTTILYLKEK
jgi:uroporphyrinogen decarboxylase